MKLNKLLSLMLAGAAILSFAACGKDPAEGTGDDTVNNDAAGDDSAAVELPYANSTELINHIWNTYEDDKKFAVAGGDADHMADGQAGEIVVGDGEYLDYMVGYPKAEIAKIDNAASLVFMMNQNSFTVGAYHFTSAENATAAAELIKTNILGRQWMCGFPEKLVIISMPGDYLISVFGLEADFVTPFVEKALAAAEGAKVVVETAIEW